MEMSRLQTFFTPQRRGSFISLISSWLSLLAVVLHSAQETHRVAPFHTLRQVYWTTPTFPQSHLKSERTGRLGVQPDHRSDLYSLGVTFYEMLTGVLPFTQYVEDVFFSPPPTSPYHHLDSAQ